MTDITLNTIPATTILALRGLVPTCADQGQLWDTTRVCGRRRSAHNGRPWQ